MKFSILIANYNNGKYFKECYDSILNQTFIDWEVIIVDDSSIDDSIQVIESIIGSDKRFNLYKNDKNYGCGYTKRKCVELATGELCGFLDPDDALTSDALDKMIKAFVEQNDIVLVHSNHIICDEKLTPIRANTYAQAAGDLNSFFNLSYHVTAFAAFSRTSYLNTAGIDPYMRRAVDQDLYLKMAETGNFYFLNELLYLYRKHNKGIATSATEEATYWQWYAVIQSARRRKINIENLFVKTYISRYKYERLLAGKKKETSKIKKFKLKLLHYFKLG